MDGFGRKKKIYGRIAKIRELTGTIYIFKLKKYNNCTY